MGQDNFESMCLKKEENMFASGIGKSSLSQLAGFEWIGAHMLRTGTTCMHDPKLVPLIYKISPLLKMIHVQYVARESPQIRTQVRNI